MNEDGYLVIIERAPHNYSAYVPDVPGCITTGNTVEETIANMREALEGHFELMREDGLPIPAPSTRAAYVSVQADTHAGVQGT